MTRFEANLRDAITDVLNGDEMSEDRVDFLNDTYSWENRQWQWKELLTSLL